MDKLNHDQRINDPFGDLEQRLARLRERMATAGRTSAVEALDRAIACQYGPAENKAA